MKNKKKFIIAGAIVLGVILSFIVYLGEEKKPTATEPQETTAEMQAETTAEETIDEEIFNAETEEETTANADDFNVMFLDLWFKYKKVLTIANSGNWIKVDSNPTDFPYYEDVSAVEAIAKINDVLGFDLTTEMTRTTKEDGRQSASNDKYVVAWTYSEEKGLEVTYAHKGNKGAAQ